MRCEISAGLRTGCLPDVHFNWATTNILRNGKNVVPSERMGYASSSIGMSSSRNCCHCVSVSRLFTGVSAVPVIHCSTGSSPVSSWMYVVSHASTRQPASVSNVA